MLVEKIKLKKLREALGQELWRIRKGKDMPLEEAARRSGVSSKLLRKCEHGGGVPINIWIKIIKFYKQKINIELVD